MKRYLLNSAFLIPLLWAAPILAAEPTESTGAPADDSKQLSATIDRVLSSSWEKHKVIPSPQTDDATFCRRVYLDLVGRIPRICEVLEFMEKRDENKRAELVEKLLNADGCSEHFALHWSAQMLPPNDNQNFAFFGRGNGGTPFQTWMRESLQKNVGYDQIVRTILTGQRNNNVQQEYFQANESKPEKIAATTSRVFTGISVECAQCHNHPFRPELKREKFWEFAAFFADTQPGRRGQPGNSKTREIKIPDTDKVAQASFLDGTKPDWKENSNTREVLADWLTSKDNPYFSKAAVNNVWTAFFNCKLADPNEENPEFPNHAELLDTVAKDFAEHGFDLKYLIRSIVLSSTYQRASTFKSLSDDVPGSYGRMVIRGMTGEQLYNSLSLATRYQRRNLLLGEDQNSSPDRDAAGRQEFTQRFGRRDKASESQTSIPQALTLMNGKIVTDAVSAASATAGSIADAPEFTPADRIRLVYLAVLSRNPRKDESERLVAYLKEGGPTRDPKAALEDVYWALINSSEFCLNH